MPEEQKQNEQQFLEEKQDFGSQFDALLEEFHLSRKHFLYGIGCFVLIVLVIFGSMWVYGWHKERKQKAAQKNSKKPFISSEQLGTKAASKIGKIFPIQPERIGETGLQATIILGSEREAKTSLHGFILTFRRMQNAYSANIDELLNTATDRRSSLKSHLALLRKLHEEGSEAFQKIQAELANIKIRYDERLKKQEIADSNFFQQLGALNAQTAQDILDEFLEVSSEIVKLRGRFKALEKIKMLFEQGLPKVLARIRDIELNEEILVSGLKIYDVKGSSLNLIVPVNNDDGKNISEPASLRSLPSFIPLTPLKTGGRDFITEPGGGFKNFFKAGTSTKAIAPKP